MSSLISVNSFIKGLNLIFFQKSGLLSTLPNLAVGFCPVGYCPVGFCPSGLLSQWAFVRSPTLTKSENSINATECGISSGSTPFWLRHKISSAKEIYFCLEIITCDPLMYTMDLPQVYCFRPEGRIHKYIKG